MDGSWWRVLTKRGPLEKGMAKPLQYSCLENPMNSMKNHRYSHPQREHLDVWTSPGKVSVIKDFTVMTGRALCLHDQEMLWGGNPGTKDHMASKEDSASCFRCKVRLLICCSLVS